MDIMYTPSGMPVDSAPDLESARSTAERMCREFGPHYAAEADLVDVARATCVREGPAKELVEEQPEYEQIGRTAVRERDPEDFIPSHRNGNEGETRTYYKNSDDATVARWGVGTGNTRRIRIQNNEGKWIIVCKSTRKTRRGAVIEGGLPTKGPRTRAQLRRLHRLEGKGLPFKAWLRQCASQIEEHALIASKAGA